MDGGQLAFFTFTRVMHLGAAIVIVGGTVFLRCVLLPAVAEALAPEDHDRLRGRIMGVWKRFVHQGILLLLVSGGINYWRTIASGAHKGDGLYHALMGTKILLALGIFFIASALVGKAPAFEPLRRNARKWLAVNIVLAAVIVVMSGFLRMRDSFRTPSLPATAVTVTVVP